MSDKTSSTNKMDFRNAIGNLSDDALQTIAEGIETMEMMGNAFDTAEMKEIGAVLYGFCDVQGFVIPFDNVVTWLEYGRKDAAKRALVKHFKENIDYKISFPTPVGGVHKNNMPEKILLTAQCFQKFCMKAGTERADVIRQFYIEMVKGVKRLRKAIEHGEVALVSLQPTERNTDTLSLVKTRLDLAESHPTLQSVILEACGKRAHVIAQVYSVLNTAVTGLRKSEVAKLLKRKKKSFTHRDYMSIEQSKTLDMLVQRMIRTLKDDMEYYKRNELMVKHVAQELANDVFNFCEKHLHDTTPLLNKETEPTMTIEEARTISYKRQRLEVE